MFAWLAFALSLVVYGQEEGILNEGDAGFVSETVPAYEPPPLDAGLPVVNPFAELAEQKRKRDAINAALAKTDHLADLKARIASGEIKTLLGARTFLRNRDDELARRFDLYLLDAVPFAVGNMKSRTLEK
jgi:hypothetical protein